MRRLVIFSVFLVLTHTILIDVSRTLGDQHPASSTLTNYHLSDCALPCWVGIQIGKTDSIEGSRLVLHAFPDYEVIDARPSFGLVTTGDTIISSWEIHLRQKANPNKLFMIAFNLTNSDGIIRGITLTSVAASHLPSISELTEIFGLPVCVVQNPGVSNTPLMVMYQSASQPTMRITARLMNRGKGWDQPAYEIKLVTSFPPNCKDWHGFTNLTKHLRGK